MCEHVCNVMPKLYQLTQNASSAMFFPMLTYFGNFVDMVASAFGI